MNRIVVSGTDKNGNVTRKAFTGRVIVESFRSNNRTSFQAAVTQKNAIVVWANEPASYFEVFESFDHLAASGCPADFISAVASATGETYAEELDI